MTPVIRIEDPDQPEVRAMLVASDTYYAALYPAESNHLLDTAELKRPSVLFHVARLDGSVAGFGALVRQADYGEIKRMYVDPAARGHGLGRRLLGALEECAHREGLRCLRLETGVKQPEALALYRASGYREIEPFGAYRPDPLSVFMEKRLAA